MTSVESNNYRASALYLVFDRKWRRSHWRVNKTPASVLCIRILERYSRSRSLDKKFCRQFANRFCERVGFSGSASASFFRSINTWLDCRLGWLRGGDWTAMKCDMDSAISGAERFCCLSRKVELDPKLGWMVKHYRSIFYREIKGVFLIRNFDSDYTPINYCVLCGKTMRGKRERWCSSCEAKHQWLERRMQEQAEVKRLINKLKKVVKDENKRLEKKAV